MLSARSTLLLVGLLTSSCSLSLDGPESRLTIQVPAAVPMGGLASSKYELFPGMGLSGVNAPANSYQFDCLVVNVVGLGIAPTYGTADLALLDGALNGAACTYPGVSAIAPNSAANSKLSLKVPSGPKRLVQVGGVVAGLSDMCTKTQIGVPNDSTGLAFFELGRAIVDLFHDTAVSIDETYNTATAAQKQDRLMTCTGASASDYQTLIQSTPGLISYWRLSENAGSTAADLEVGTSAIAVGDLSLSSVTFGNAGPPGIGLTAIHAGLNGIGTAAGTSFGTGDFSVEFWVKYSGGCQDGAGVFFVMRHSGAALIRFRCTNVNSVLFEAEDNTGAVAAATSTVSGINDGQWHHVAGTKSGTTVSVTVDASTPGTISGGITGNFNFTTAPKTQIGQDTVFGEYQTADYAEVAIYTQALTAAQISDHFLQGD